MGFADGFQLLLMSESTVGDLNRRLDDELLPMCRFRPNITVAGSLPCAEDTWQAMRVGNERACVFSSCPVLVV